MALKSAALEKQEEIARQVWADMRRAKRLLVRPYWFVLRLMQVTDSSQAEMAAKQRPTTSVREQQPPSLDDDDDDDDDDDGSRTQAAGEFFDD